jgi:hypothetical protein
MPEPIKFIDIKGRTWQLYGAKFKNEIDDMYYRIAFYAIDDAHAKEQLAFIKKNAVFDGLTIGMSKKK